MPKVIIRSSSTVRIGKSRNDDDDANFQELVWRLRRSSSTRYSNKLYLSTNAKALSAILHFSAVFLHNGGENAFIMAHATWKKPSTFSK